MLATSLEGSIQTSEYASTGDMFVITFAIWGRVIFFVERQGGYEKKYHGHTGEFFFSVRGKMQGAALRQPR